VSPDNPGCRAHPDRPRLLVLGTGFAAFALLRRVDLRAYDVTVVSPRNHFVFTPLLPSTTVGTVEFRTVIESVRMARPGVRLRLGKAKALDLEGRRVLCQGLEGELAWEEPFDFLTLAVGCVTNTFGLSGVEQHAFFLKEVDDARRIRQALVANLERASLPGVPAEERARLVHFACVGGGPTGVRFAGELYDLLGKELRRSYPHLAGDVRVSLLDAAPAVLTSYDASLRQYVQRAFERRGVVVRTGIRVEDVTDTGIQLSGGEFLPCGLVLWSAGFARNPLVAALDVQKDRTGRILTDEALQVVGHSGVYALGDCARPAEQDLPQLAQVAEQQGRYLARSLNARARGLPVRPFRWRPWGIHSFIGGGAAVGETSEHGRRTSGFWAYQQWRAATWSQLVSVRSKILVPLDRLRAFVFGRDITKL
jgi:NADH:ubiquinone reductase (non-electrogenic)